MVQKQFEAGFAAGKKDSENNQAPVYGAWDKGYIKQTTENGFVPVPPEAELFAFGYIKGYWG